MFRYKKMYLQICKSIRIINFTRNFKDTAHKLLLFSLMLAPQFLFAQEIFIAAKNGDNILLMSILSKDSTNANITNEMGNTPLHIASFYGKLKCLKPLVSYGALIDVKNKLGVTPLHYAFLANRKKAVKYLVDNNAAIDYIDEQGNTLLILSVLNNDIELVNMFLIKGININHISGRGNTALTIAKRENYYEIAKVLESKGAKDPQAEIVLKGAYLGQKPPGLVAKVFAPNVVSTEKGQLNAVFAPNGNEFHFSERNGMKPTVMKFMSLKNNVWTKPQNMPFSGIYDDVDQYIAKDGKRIYFCSNRPQKKKKKTDHDFWYSELKNGKWSEPVLFDTILMSDKDDYYPVFTENKTLYFSSQREGKGTNNIYFSRFKNGKYTKPLKLGKEINTMSREFDPFISPDESYLIFASERESGFGYADLYICFKKKDMTWTNAINMGKEVNTKGMEFTPMVTHDGKYLFFTRGTGTDTDIYWVSTEVIENLKKKTNSTTLRT
ncbi:MAG: hypothetical protein B6I20_06975 [Bacteroidetes bacterium 4572_117]|nr:MAG: hypothetical protein B6I20_06975 [Bacteroidetes bacterium 4572_117]